MGAEAEQRAKALGFRSFSAYIQHLLRNDLMDGGSMVLRESPIDSSSSGLNPAEQKTVEIVKTYGKIGRAAK